MADNKNRKIELITKTHITEWVSVIVSFLAVVGSIITAILCVNKVINNQTQQQTQVVIEPRDGDIIVNDNGNYKLLQLINADDITLPTKIQEIQLKAKESESAKRVDVNNKNGEDWSGRDSFKYVINSIHINTNKLFNLVGTIKKIDFFCDFYTEKNITALWDCGDKCFTKNLYNDESKEVISEYNNIVSEYEYVTKEINDGFEWCKIRLELEYMIDKRKICDTVSTDWMATTQDFSL